MVDFRNRKILDDGTVVCNDDALIEILYSGQDLSGIFCNDPENQIEWNKANLINDTDYLPPIFTTEEQYKDIDWYQYWRTPDEYKDIDVLQWCLDKCKTDEEIDRVKLEISEFENRNMLLIMRHLIYCVDIWRENKIFWGVGRGSSVCSFVLFLIGINRINPLQYDLSINEWLR